MSAQPGAARSQGLHTAGACTKPGRAQNRRPRGMVCLCNEDGQEKNRTQIRTHSDRVSSDSRKAILGSTARRQPESN